MSLNDQAKQFLNSTILEKVRSPDAKIAALLIVYGAKIYTKGEKGIEPFKYSSIDLMQDVFTELLKIEGDLYSKYGRLPASDPSYADAMKLLDSCSFGLSAVKSMIKREETPDACKSFTLNETNHLVCSGTVTPTVEELYHGLV